MDFNIFKDNLTKFIGWYSRHIDKNAIEFDAPKKNAYKQILSYLHDLESIFKDINVNIIIESQNFEPINYFYGKLISIIQAIDKAFIALNQAKDKFNASKDDQNYVLSKLRNTTLLIALAAHPEYLPIFLKLLYVYLNNHPNLKDESSPSPTPTDSEVADQLPIKDRASLKAPIDSEGSRQMVAESKADPMSNPAEMEGVKQVEVKADLRLTPESEGSGQLTSESKAGPGLSTVKKEGAEQVTAESTKAEPGPVPAVGEGSGQVKSESKADPGPSLVEREGSGQVKAESKADPGPVPAVGEASGQITPGPKADPSPVPAVGEASGQITPGPKADPSPVPAVGVGPGQVKAESKAEPDPVPAVGVGPGQVKAESKADPGPSLVEREGSGQIPAGTKADPGPVPAVGEGAGQITPGPKADPGPVPAVGEGAGQITAGPKAGPGTIHPLGGVVVPPSPANLDFNNVVTNDADFSKSEPIIYINLESRMKGNWEEVENQIKNIMNIFKDISVGSVTTLVEEKYHFYENYIVTNVITNKYMKDIIGLNAEGKNNRLTITGIPNSGYDGTLKFKLSFDIISLDRIDRICEEKSVELYIPVNPKDLWKNLPVLDFEGYEYPNEKAESVAISSMGKILTVASCRGRSHAHAGKPRDDNYDFKCDLGSGWNVVAAADGAGSARFSRKGSDLACTTVVETLAKIFSNIDNLNKIESEIKQMHENLKMNHVSLEKDDNLKTPLNETIYTTVYAAYKSILDEYKQKKESHQSYDDITLSAYHTTLMFMFFKKFDFGYFFGSFWIGDGAIVLYNLNGTGEVKVLGKPDSGEFAGQTRFLTMKGEIDREKVKERTRLNFAESFEAIILATDGITDPYFPSDADTQSPEKWNNFWTKILKEGDKGSDKDNVGCPELFNADATLEEKAKALLKWLEFWSKGNHDDRTLLIVT